MRREAWRNPFDPHLNTALMLTRKTHKDRERVSYTRDSANTHMTSSVQRVIILE